MSKFEELMFKGAREGILSIPDTTAADTYVLSLYSEASEGDPRKMVMLVCYNTNAQWQSRTTASVQKPARGTTHDANEAKWVFPFWVFWNEKPNNAGIVGAIREFATSDADEISARQEWIKSLGCWFTDEEESEDIDRTVELGQKIMHEFAGMCIRVAKRLHDEGVVKEKFGRDIPIIAGDGEPFIPCIEIAKMTELANPPGLSKEFSNWAASRERKVEGK